MASQLVPRLTLSEVVSDSWWKFDLGVAPGPYGHSIMRRGQGRALSEQWKGTSKCSLQGCSGHQFAPLGQGGSPVLLEDVAAVKVTVLIEVIVDRGVGGGKLLEGLHVSELGHRRFSSSERLV